LGRGTTDGRWGRWTGQDVGWIGETSHFFCWGQFESAPNEDCRFRLQSKIRGT